MEIFGQIRINDYERASDSKWREGTLVFDKTEKYWQCKVHFKANKNPSSVRQYKLSPKDIKCYACKHKRFTLELISGTTITFITEGDKSKQSFEELFKEIKSQPLKGSSGFQLSLKKIPGSSLTSPSPRSPLKTSPRTLQETRSKSPKKYPPLTFSPALSKASSRQSENTPEGRRGQKRELEQGKDGKENLNSENWLSTDKKSENNFLSRSAEKSRQTLASLEATSFYQNSDVKTYSPFNRRKPALLPDPEKYKRPRLTGQANYSWCKLNGLSKQTTANKQTNLQGFSNLGNTCYMNAILQSLFGLDTLATDLTNRRTVRAMAKESLYSSLSCLLNAKRRLGLSPEHRRQYLRNVKSAISTSAKRFSGQGQHDAHEFLGQVLDQMKEEVLKINKSTPSPEREKEAMTASTCDQEYTNPTTMNFEFEVVHTIKCQQCEEEVTKSETFHDLSVDLPRSDFHTYSVQDALDQFFCEEKIEYCCETCGGKASIVTHKYTRLPRVLILHLKRYSFHSSRLGSVKMGCRVHIPRYLTLQSHCIEQTHPPYPPTIQSVSSPLKLTERAASDLKPSKDTSRKLFSEFGYPQRTPTPNTTGKFSFKRSSLGQDKERSGTIRRNILTRKERSASESDLQKALRDSEQEAKKYQKQADEESHQLDSILNQSMKEAEQHKQHRMQEDQLLADALEISVKESNQLEADIQGFEMDSENNSEEIFVKSENIGSHQGSGENTQNSDGFFEPDLSDYNLRHLSEEEQFQLALKMSMSDMDVPDQEMAAADQTQTKAGMLTTPEQEETLAPSATSNTNSDSAIQSEKWIELDDSENTQGFSVSFENNGSAATSQEDSKIWNVNSENGKKQQQIQDDQKLISELFDDSFELVFDEEKPNTDNSQQNDIERNVKDRNSRHGSGAVDGTETMVIGSDCEEDAKPNDSINSDTKEEADKSTKSQMKSSKPDKVESVVFVQEDSSEDNKENKTPPKSSSNDVQYDWLDEKEEDRRKEEEDLNKALKLSLSDCVDIDQEDEDLRKAKELSLQDCNIVEENQSDCVMAESKFNVQRSREEEQQLKENAEKGSLPYSYRLVSVVSHMGSSSVSGHYISDVNDIRKKSWSSFDDSEVSAITERDVRGSREKSGYIFFYMDKNIYGELQDHYATQNALESHSSLSLVSK